MSSISRLTISFAVMIAVACGSAVAQERGREEHRPDEHRQEDHRPAEVPRHAELHEGPQSYQRITEPKGWNARPGDFDRAAYQHNFQAARTFRIGPYHRPQGWVARRWGYGMILPRSFWAPEYIIADYWLFALEVPPAGFEWVRVGPDALLVSITSGEILQAEYGVFA